MEYPEISIVIGSWGSYNSCNERALGSEWLNLADFESWEEIEEALNKQGWAIFMRYSEIMQSFLPTNSILLLQDGTADLKTVYRWSAFRITLRMCTSEKSSATDTRSLL